MLKYLISQFTSSVYCGIRQVTAQMLLHFLTITYSSGIWKPVELTAEYVNYIYIITARKRSWRQGNVFTRVCHSVQGGMRGMHALLPCIPPCHAGPPPHVPPRHACPYHAHPLPRMPPCHPPPPPPDDMVNEWAVRILLECILVNWQLCLGGGGLQSHEITQLKIMKNYILFNYYFFSQISSSTDLEGKGQPKFTSGRWNPHHNCSQIATANDSSIRGWDLRTME